MIGVQSVSNNSYQSIVTAVQQENKESLANSKSAQVSSVKDSFDVYCKIKLPKVAKQKWTKLQVHFGQSCKLSHTGSREWCSA